MTVLILIFVQFMMNYLTSVSSGSLCGWGGKSDHLRINKMWLTGVRIT